MKKQKVVFLIRQTQTDCDYYERTIYVLDDEDEAYRYAKKLNELYADNVILDDEGQFVEVEDTGEDYHYYDVEEIRTNVPLAEEDEEFQKCFK